ncbi:IclR family transcriptional regulator [Gordonia sp. CPCC 206044]|uniref:IclR family transcriptional regulator n=1 Tax=Gordonia sp. CPCC 206044 TaxID=3140793 RepID=UPI003AF3B03C
MDTTRPRQYSSVVQKRVIERPSYTITSVDNALRLLEMLRDVGALRLSDAATELGVANSTAHRLLAMLVYRGFAVQDEHRRYHPGPAMGAGPARQGWTRDLTDRVRPYMEALTARSGETTNLVIRVGTQARFLYSVQAPSILRVGDRQGQVLDAHRTAGGRALLAELDEGVLAQLYLRPDREDDPDDTDSRLSRAEFDEFRRQLSGVRDSRLGINLEQSEDGVAAFGMAIHNGKGDAVGAVTVAVPANRYEQHIRGPLIGQLRRCVREIEIEIADIEP